MLNLHGFVENFHSYVADADSLAVVDISTISTGRVVHLLSTHTFDRSALYGFASPRRSALWLRLLRENSLSTENRETTRHIFRSINA